MVISMIEGLNVRLRILELEDAPNILQYWNDLEIRSYLAFLTPLSRQMEEEFIKRNWEGFKKKTDFVFGIETLIDNTLIGATGIHAVDWINRSAELGIAIWNKAYHSTGYGTEASQLILFYAFEVLHLHRVQLRVYDYNKRAIKSYEKIGFRHVGKWRQARYLYGKYHDVILMDILAEEFSLPPKLNEHLTQKYRSTTLSP